jgi:hypothetical protein
MLKAPGAGRLMCIVAPALHDRLGRCRAMPYHRAMSKVEEIEQAIEKLSAEELAEIRAWLWDRDIERDAVAGRLDHLAEEALSEYRSGQARRL